MQDKNSAIRAIVVRIAGQKRIHSTPRFRRESGTAKRNFNKLQEHGRSGWCSRNSKEQVNVSPMCTLPPNMPSGHFLAPASTSLLR